jgi:hypothetical protein
MEEFERPEQGAVFIVLKEIGHDCLGDIVAYVEVSCEYEWWFNGGY